MQKIKCYINLNIIEEDEGDTKNGQGYSDGTGCGYGSSHRYGQGYSDCSCCGFGVGPGSAPIYIKYIDRFPPDDKKFFNFGSGPGYGTGTGMGTLNGSGSGDDIAREWFNGN